MRPDEHRTKRVRKRLAHLALAAAAALSAFCTSGDGGNSDDDEAAALEQLRSQVITAMFPAGGVSHSYESFQYPAGGQPFATERAIWRFADGGEARVHAGDAPPTIFANGQRHQPDASGGISATAINSLKLEEERSFLGTASILFGQPADGARVEEANVDGIPALSIDVTVGGSGETGTARVFVARRDYLPIRIEFPLYNVLFRHEVVERDSLPTDFFSPDVLENAADTPE